MTVVVTRNVAPRFRGFLASVMLEIAPGVYTGPRISRNVRERVWKVMTEWFDAGATTGGHPEDQASIVMTWLDREAPGGQAVETLGVPARRLIDADGIMLVQRL
jgi:CRISPR-associated protein Cas2